MLFTFLGKRKFKPILEVITFKLKYITSTKINPPQAEFSFRSDLLSKQDMPA